MSAAAQEYIELGRISGVFGVRGWVRVYSYTRPPENILDYPDWWLIVESERRRFRLLQGRRQGNGLVAHLAGEKDQPYEDRDQAAVLVGASVFVRRSDLPQPGSGEYYWSDLVGLGVETTKGLSLGQVSSLMETGANDVLVVQGENELLIPFVIGHIVQQVDLKAGLITVDWNPEFF